MKKFNGSEWEVRYCTQIQVSNKMNIKKWKKDGYFLKKKYFLSRKKFKFKPSVRLGQIMGFHKRLIIQLSKNYSIVWLQFTLEFIRRTSTTKWLFTAGWNYFFFLLIRLKYSFWNHDFLIYSAGVGRTGTLIAIFNLVLISKKYYITYEKIQTDPGKNMLLVSLPNILIFPYYSYTKMRMKK